MNRLTLEGIVLPSDKFNFSSWVEQLRQLPTPALILMIAAGVIFLLYGRSLFRGIVILNAMIFGAYLGWQIGESTQYLYVITIGFAVVFGLLAWPLFKLAVAMSSGLAGAAMVWQVVSLNERMTSYWPVFVIIGFLVFAVLGWFLLKGMITIVTAVQGASMILLSLVVLSDRTGILAGSDWTRVDSLGVVHLAVVILAMVGILYQIGFTGKKTSSGSAD